LDIVVEGVHEVGLFRLQHLLVTDWASLDTTSLPISGIGTYLESERSGNTASDAIQSRHLLQRYIVGTALVAVDNDGTRRESF